MNGIEDQRTRDALDRVDRAIDRIEAAPAADARGKADKEELERLRAAHALLRDRVEAAVGEIDSLLASGRSEAA